MSSNNSIETPHMKTRLGKTPSAFASILSSAVALRYFFLAVSRINPFNVLGFFKENRPGWRESRENNWEKIENYSDKPVAEKAANNAASIGMGSLFTTIIGWYSLNTYKDIKSLYKEAVAYELGKKPEDVGFIDIFWRSKNDAIKTTCKAFLSRTAVRALVAATFFMPWHKLRGDQTEKPDFNANTDVGVGTIGFYMMWESMIRQGSFFDAQQKLAATAIDHASNSKYETISPSDVQTMLTLQRKHVDKKYQWPDGASPAGQNEMSLAYRISELLNLTYNNVPVGFERAHFTLGKFNYLIGFGLLDKFPASLAFVELAAKSPDMEAVKAAAAEIKSGKNPAEVFIKHGIDINLLPKSPDQLISGASKTPQVKAFDSNLLNNNDNPQPQQTTQDADISQKALEAAKEKTEIKK